MKTTTQILLAVVVLNVATSDAESATKQRVDFATQVKQLLSDRCFKCHGPDSENRQADLRLDDRDAVFSHTASSGLRVIRPGKIRRSELVRRITSHDEGEVMPPVDSNLALTESEKELLTNWVQQGAEWTPHWSFTAPVAGELPTPVNKQWSRNEIDQFILARLEQEGLEPAPQSARTRLLRRLSFDLTGLPPTIEQLDAFLDDKSDNAWEKAINRLLKSEHYGERMASDWLDVARYSDTFGFQVDRERRVWPWRDWVIKAFNENMPYDQFVSWQLAGDMLPDATEEQILATTFNRLHSQKVEGGSTPEEFRVEYVADRTHTFATAFLGLTMECSRCHDHKYDPITQSEYYQLFAYFNNIDEAGLYSYFTNSTPTPTLLLSNDQQKQQQAENAESISNLESELAKTISEQTQAFEEWLTQRPNDVAIADQVLHMSFDDFKSGANKAIEGVSNTGVQLSGDDAVGTSVGNFSRNQPFSLSLWISTPEVMERAVVLHRSRAWTDSASRGYQLLFEEGKLSFSLIHFWPGNAIRVMTDDVLPIDQWFHLTVTYDGSSRADGVTIYLNGEQASSHVVRDNLYKNITGSGGDNIALGQRFRDKGFAGGSVDELFVFQREIEALEVKQVYDGKSLEDLLALPVDEVKGPNRQLLFDFYLANHNEATKAQLSALRAARDQRSQLVDGVTEIMVMQDMEQRRQTYRLERGAYDAPQEPVEPGVPAALAIPGREFSPDRLGLAKWLTDSANPLAGRVVVNRIWQMMFGAGFVHTPEDFGSQGLSPTHPRLLDWLTRDFIDNGWDVKRLIKQIAMSATYQQDSVATDEKQQRDPENKLLARGPLNQLPAEMLRDNVLFTSGLLVDKRGGPPAKPYELTASFKPVGKDNGEGLYRRSVYTYWKRTAPAPVMMTLDASKREVCVVKRERTASPLQAIVMLNDPQMVEAARVFADRVFEKHPEVTKDVLALVFRMLTSRSPSSAELEVIKLGYEEQLKYFETHPDRIQELMKTGDKPAVDATSKERAALTIVVSTLLSFDESVMKR